MAEEIPTPISSSISIPSTVQSPSPSPTPEETPEPEIVAELSSSFDLSQIPAYSGTPYATVNDNVPYFTDSEMSTGSYAFYSNLDSLGRCGVCVASVRSPHEKF